MMKSAQTWFVNTDQVHNSLDTFDRWFEAGVLVTSGEARFLDAVNKIQQGDIAFAYKSGTGIVGAGVVLDSRALVTRDCLSPEEEVEYHRAVCWYADLRLDPIPHGVIRQLRGMWPTSAVARLIAGATELQAEIDLRSNTIGRDEAEVNARLAPGSTMAKQLINARRGQGKFREGVLGTWGRRCAVTGCGLETVLRASHVKPWRQSSDAERLDAANGLPLIATLDALFDKWLISFDEDGRILVSKRIDTADRFIIGSATALRTKPSGALSGYLNEHRKIFYILQQVSIS